MHRMGFVVAVGLFALALGASSSAQEQDMKALSRSIAVAIQAQEQGWVLEHELTRPDETTQRWARGEEHLATRPDETIHQWAPGSEHLVIGVNRMADADAAAALLNETPRRLPGGGLPERRTDVGDDALLYSGYSDTGVAVIYFRKRALFVNLYGPSKDMTVRVARLVAAEIR